MIDDTVTAQIKNIVDSAQTIVIIYPKNATLDQRAVAASLYLALSTAQKSVRLVTPQVEQRTDEPLAGIEQTQQDMGNQNLGISFEYTPEQVDKVSYHIGEETGKFYLSIKPKPGFPPLDANSVEFTYTGAAAEAVFLVGVNELESLEHLYFGYEDLYNSVSLVSINNFATSFGTVKVDAGNTSSSSEVLAQLLPGLGLTIDSDVATNLLFGIESSTQNLSSVTTSAETFEVVAQLLRAGARRSFKRAGQEQSSQLQRTRMSNEIPPLQEPRKNGKAKNAKSVAKNDGANPPAEFTPVRRI